MKWGVLVLPLALAVSGCANVAEINETLPTMSVISGKKPHEYAQCLVENWPPAAEPCSLSRTRKACG